MYATQSGTNYYFGRKLIKNASGYVYSDRLGSIGQFFPYGNQRGTVTSNDTEKFTGYFRDSETGLDCASNRYYGPGAARFMTPDRGMGGAKPTDPGSWNKYAYASGDPVNRADPGGTQDCDIEAPDCYCQIYGQLGSPNGYDPNCDPNYCPPGICGTDGSGGGTNPPAQVPCYDNLEQIQAVLTSLESAVYSQFANDPNLTLQQKVALGGVITDAVDAEMSAIGAYMWPSASGASPPGPDPAYYKGGHFNLILNNGPGSELADVLGGVGSAAYAAFQSDVVGRFDASTLGQALHGSSGALSLGQPSENDYFHFDTASPYEALFGIGALIHGIRDVAGGNLPRLLFGRYPCLDPGF